jgi:hypothetical protein
MSRSATIWSQYVLIEAPDEAKVPFWHPDEDEAEVHRKLKPWNTVEINLGRWIGQ